MNIVERRYNGLSRTLAITTATVVKASAGAVFTITFSAVGTKPTLIYDSSVNSALTNANCLGSVVANEYLSLDFKSGLVVVPGEGAVVNVFFN